MIKSKWGGKRKIKQLEDDIAALKKMNEKYSDKIASLEADLSDKPDKSYVNSKVNDAEKHLREDLEKKEELRDHEYRIVDLEYKSKVTDESIKDQTDNHKRDIESLRKRINELSNQINIMNGMVKPHCKLKEYTEAVEERAEFIVRLSKFDFITDDVKKLGNVGKSGLVEMEGTKKSISSLSYEDPEYVMPYDEFINCVKRLNVALETISKTSKPVIDAVNVAIAAIPDIYRNKEHLETVKTYHHILHSINGAKEIVGHNIEKVNTTMNEINELRKIYGKFIKS